MVLRAALVAGLMLGLVGAGPGVAQEPDTSGPRRIAPAGQHPVQGGIYQRPFLASVGRTAVGGYVEGNTNYFRTDGIGGVLHGAPPLQHLSVLVGRRRIRFISELEFEHGAEEIALETALVDFTVNPSFILRAGILLPPVGAFNVNHD